MNQILDLTWKLMNETIWTSFRRELSRNRQSWGTQVTTADTSTRCVIQYVSAAISGTSAGCNNPRHRSGDTSASEHIWRVSMCVYACASTNIYFERSEVNGLLVVLFVFPDIVFYCYLSLTFFSLFPSKHLRI